MFQAKKQRIGKEDQVISPALRTANLVGHSPIPTLDEARTCLQRLRRRWPAEREGYLEEVIAATGAPSDEFRFSSSQRPRIRREGDAYVLDFPSLRRRPLDSPGFDSRIYLAICTAGLSTKVWSRISPPQRYSGASEQAVIPTRDLRSTIGTYRAVTEASVTWLYSRLRVAMREHTSSFTSHKKGRLEVVG